LAHWPRRAKAQPAPRCKVALDIHFLDEQNPAPVVLLGTWTVLVWSEAWKAEGERGKFNLLY
jgi:hypothetical protein